MSVHKWAFRRETGIRPKFGEENLIMRRLYHSLEPYRTWNDLSGVPTQAQVSDYGAVFNLEFSPGGNVLAAACERRSIVLFDAITQKQTHHIMEAHSDNVNCVKFLDKCTFATCSDDTTVALWDLRNLKQKVRSLQGHSNWVKNIEYSWTNGLLVTSGFDGSIFTWDINAPTTDGLTYQKVFHTSGLMRCRIAPDCNKLVLCTTGGYLMIIHDLDLTTLHDDLGGFKPTIYRLMQMGNQYIPQAGKFDHIFSKKMKRNRVELISDFPEDNDAEIVLALQIHPKGLSFLSRNISYNGESEWSCIHDINEEPYDITIPKVEKRKRRKRCKQHRNVRPKNDDDPVDTPSTSAGIEPTIPQIPHLNDNVPSTSAAAIGRMNTRSRTRANQAISNNNSPSSSHNTSNGYTELYSNGPITSNGASNSHAHMNGHGPNTRNASHIRLSRPSTSSRSEFIPDIWAAEISVQERNARQAAQQVNSVTGYDSVYAISSGILPMPLLDDETLNLSYSSDCPLSAGTNPWADKHILQNANKLLYYIKESNKGKGFIKEPCFSADGRIICSPYNTSVRLLSYEQDCSEHPNACERLKKSPKQLVEVKTIKCHSDIVLSTAFSPHQPLMVTGCKLGKVTWHYPNL